MSVSELAIVLHLMSGFDANVNAKDVLCLSQNIYHEARGETIAGMEAVGHVTLNRVNSPRYADDVCGVVYETRKSKGRTVAQFSWVVHEPKVDLKDPLEKESFELAVEIALMQIASNTPDATYLDGATLYFNPSVVQPKWYDNTWEVAQIGNHLFLIDEQ